MPLFAPTNLIINSYTVCIYVLEFPFISHPFLNESTYKSSNAWRVSQAGGGGGNVEAWNWSAHKKHNAFPLNDVISGHNFCPLTVSVPWSSQLSSSWKWKLLHHRTGNFSKYLHTCIFSWEIGVNQCSCHLTMKILCVESSESSRLPLQYAWLIQQIFTHLFLGHNSSSYLSNMLTQSQEQSSM